METANGTPPEPEPEKKPDMQPLPGKPAEAVVVHEGTKPCGCHVTEFSNKQIMTQPCLACGLLFAASEMQNSANSLTQAGNALAATARSLQQAEAQRFQNRLRGL